MASFRYKAMTATGSVVRGTISAETEAEAVKNIRSDGLIPITAKPDGGDGFLAKLRPNSTRRSFLRASQLTLVTQEMADLLDAGLELDRVLSVVADLRDVRGFRPTLLAVRSRVREGAMLADALAATGAVSKFYVSMVRAGEMGGQLTQTMAKLADYLSRTQAIRESVVSALIYPIILLVTAALAVIF
ncbi:MAG: type II secretion system F family protein, partial [Rhizomicrobium sp.]|nr:type II secretion system F family protein [Rhizomicrobium sp.]